MKFLGKATVEAEPSTRKTGRGLEIVLALGLVMAALVPVVASGPKAPTGQHSADFRTVATQLINANLLDPSMRVRKNAKYMTAAERRDYVQAVLKLKTTDSPFEEREGLSYYDQFVRWHMDLYKCTPGVHALGIEHGMTMAHAGPLFLPWHRVYLLVFEKALRDVAGKSVSIPYWDWTDPEATKSVFSDDLMGGNGDPNANYAISGPFNRHDWKLNVHPEGLESTGSRSDHIMRWLKDNPNDPDTDWDPFPTRDEVTSLMKLPRYDAPPYDTTSPLAQSFRSTLEGFKGDAVSQMECGPDGWMAVFPAAGKFRFHNQVHESVGGYLFVDGANTKVFGTMLVPTSPNDPVFFLHHANVDRLWAEWQALDAKAHAYEPQKGYPGMNGTDFMQPWNMTPNSVENIKRLGYRYE